MEIKRIACIGVGLIGHSWATLFSLKGYPIVLCDQADEILAKATSRIEANLKFLAEKGLIRKSDIKTSLKRIQVTTCIAEAVAEADYVPESILERYEAKKSVFKELDSAAPSQTILASSSSGLLMTAIQKATKRPERCLVAHPWNPPISYP